MGHGYGGMNMQMHMNYMPQTFQQPNDMAMVNYNHNLNMMSANMNPFGNIPPPPPQHPMPRFDDEKAKLQSDQQMLKKEDN